MKVKSAKSLVDAVAYIFTTSKRMPNKIQGDKGKELVNRKFKSFLRDHRVHFFSTENDDIKASVVERFNRTLKSKCGDTLLTLERNDTWTLWMTSFCHTTTVNTEIYKCHHHM